MGIGTNPFPKYATFDNFRGDSVCRCSSVIKTQAVAFKPIPEIEILWITPVWDAM